MKVDQTLSCRTGARRKSYAGVAHPNVRFGSKADMRVANVDIR